jgi:hypothetical protein
MTTMKTKKKIEMRGILPRYAEDDVEFLLQELPKCEPCSMASFIESLGGIARHAGQNGTIPGPEYARIQAAFRYAESSGLIFKPGGRNSWRIMKKVP